MSDIVSHRIIKSVDEEYEYQLNIWEERIYQQGRADAIEEFREYLKTIIPCEMPQDIWNLGVDNTCDRMLEEKKNEYCRTSVTLCGRKKVRTNQSN